VDSNQLLNSDFNYGDVVTISRTAPTIYHPGAQGCLCGMRVIDSLELAITFGQQEGSELFLIEFSDGQSLEIPTRFFTRVSSDL
jgi:hypothetical protein